MVSCLPLIPPVDGNGEPPSLEKFWKSTGDFATSRFISDPRPFPVASSNDLDPCHSAANLMNGARNSSTCTDW